MNTLRPRISPAIWVLCAALLTLSPSLAFAGHVPPVLPLTGNSNHSHEKHTGTNFPAANLSFIDLSFADLSNCTFAAGTDLSGANFTGANLTNANLSGCNIDNATFRGANLSFAALPCGGNVDFRQTILTGAIAPGGMCPQCAITPNVRDQCTVGDILSLCMSTGPFRAVVAGVVFDDANNNGVLDFGEAGIGGVTINVSTQGGPFAAATDSRGGFGGVANVAGPGSATLNAATLPAGAVLQGSPLKNFDVTACRSAQALNYPVRIQPTPTSGSTFGRLKTIYR